MGKKNLLETLMGAVVICVAGLFLVFAYSNADVGDAAGYAVTAKFDRIDGVAVGSDVRMSGIKIGTVSESKLDPETYLAVLTMTINDTVKLPLDTSASITSSGLLGEKYLALSPGAEEEMIAPGGAIETTQGSIDIFSLVGQMIFSQTGKEGDDGANK